MKRWIFYVTMMMIFFLGACNVENDFEKNIIMPTESLSVTRMPTPTEFTLSSKNQPDIPAGAEIVDWTELACYADEKISLRNSNLLNSGYLTYDEDGRIYFVDMNIGGIFASDRDGKNRRQLSREKATALQLEGEWLYYGTEEGIKRLHTKNGKSELVYDGIYGEFVLSGEKIYINATINGVGGFYAMELDGSNVVLLRNQAPTLASYTTGDKFWLGIAYKEEDVWHYREGYLYGYDEEENKLIYIANGRWFPLLAGNLLSTFGVLNGTRHVWNLETKEEYDLGVYAQNVVSDGENLYYVVKGYEFVAINCWNNGETKEILRTEESNYCDYLSLTPDMLYFSPKVYETGKTVTQLWYYDLESGETGQVY